MKPTNKEKTFSVDNGNLLGPQVFKENIKAISIMRVKNSQKRVRSDNGEPAVEGQPLPQGVKLITEVGWKHSQKKVRSDNGEPAVEGQPLPQGVKLMIKAGWKNSQKKVRSDNGEPAVEGEPLPQGVKLMTEAGWKNSQKKVRSDNGEPAVEGQPLPQGVKLITEEGWKKRQKKVRSDNGEPAVEGQPLPQGVKLTTEAGWKKRQKRVRSDNGQPAVEGQPLPQGVKLMTEASWKNSQKRVRSDNGEPAVEGQPLPQGVKLMTEASWKHSQKRVRSDNGEPAVEGEPLPQGVKLMTEAGWKNSQKRVRSDNGEPAVEGQPLPQGVKLITEEGWKKRQKKVRSDNGEPAVEGQPLPQGVKLTTEAGWKKRQKRVRSYSDNGEPQPEVNSFLSGSLNINKGMKRKKTEEETFTYSSDISKPTFTIQTTQNHPNSNEFEKTTVEEGAVINRPGWKSKKQIGETTEEAYLCTDQPLSLLDLSLPVRSNSLPTVHNSFIFFPFSQLIKEEPRSPSEKSKVDVTAVMQEVSDWIKDQRNGDNTLDNCSYLTEHTLIALENLLSGKKIPIDSISRSPSADSTPTEIRHGYVPIKREDGNKVGKQLRTTSITAVSTEKGLHSMLPPTTHSVMDMTSDSIKEKLTIEIEPKKVAATKTNIQSINHELIQIAKRNNKIIIGTVDLAYTGRQLISHSVVFCATPERIFYVDGQLYNGIDRRGEPVFSDFNSPYTFTTTRHKAPEGDFADDCFYTLYRKLSVSCMRSSDLDMEF